MLIGKENKLAHFPKCINIHGVEFPIEKSNFDMLLYRGLNILGADYLCSQQLSLTINYRDSKLILNENIESIYNLFISDLNKLCF